MFFTYRLDKTKNLLFDYTVVINDIANHIINEGYHTGMDDVFTPREHDWLGTIMDSKSYL